MYLLILSVCIMIAYTIAMIIGTCKCYDKCDNLIGAIILAWIIIPGTGTVWIPSIAHTCKCMFG
jgi:hypothetical protein